MEEKFNPAVATVKGTFWTYLSQFSGKGLTLLTTAILARLLGKDDFGVASYAIITINLLDVLQDLGVGLALIYHEEEYERTNAGFWVGIAMATFLCIVTWLLAPLGAIFFHDPRATAVIRILSLTFPISSLSNVHDSLMRKQLRFGRKIIPDFFRSAAKGIISVVLAFAGFGAWSLIYGQVIGTAVATIAFWWICPFRPSLGFAKKFVRPLLSYGIASVTVDTLSAVTLNIDYLFVGHFLGAAALGVYTISFRIPELLIKQFCGVIGRVIFPIYTKLRTSREELSNGFLSTLHYVTLVTLPMAVALVILSKPFVYVFFSPKWKEAIPVMQWVSIHTLLRSMTFNLGDIYKADGRVKLLARLSMLQVIILVPSLYWAITTYQSIVAAAWIQVVTAFISGILKLAVAGRILRTSAKEFFLALKLPAFGTVVMACVLTITMHSFREAPIYQLVVGLVVGGAAYLMALWYMGRDTMVTAGKVLRMAISR
ncbi:MAG: hypothetical protein C5B54_04645 [Acidobacteria bacterium]|nr:MAG: hypothetical protein C5B54_04645 [Acidobacteriota bacterium]